MIIDTDIIVVGGGIVGLATAMELTRRYPRAAVLVIEKEAALASHQSGHNSGVIHAGVYYAPNSLKARFCREGSAATYAFCREHGIRAERCGKLIVATNPVELAHLTALNGRCLENGLSPEWIDKKELARIEPRITGQAAILVRDSGITDYPAITRRMADIVCAAGGALLLGSPVTAIREEQSGVIVEAGERTVRGRYAVVCGGLMADRLLRMCHVEPDFRIIPFRGEYYRLPQQLNDIVSHLVYPVPDPALPFLGVHLTRMIDGSVTVGPNAVLALAREGYRWRDINAADLADMIMFRGFWNLMRRNARSAVVELRNSVFRKGYLEQCRKYCPELRLDDLLPHPAGVRAQAVLSDGTLVHDFLVRRGGRTLHVCNAPSPAATSAIPIGKYLVDEFAAAFPNSIV